MESELLKYLVSGSPFAISGVFMFVLLIAVMFLAKYVRDKTVPKEIYDRQSALLDKMVETTNNGFNKMAESQNQMLIAIEGLKRKWYYSKTLQSGK